ncbi:MAG: hypothetical protein NT069_25805, partial [Planctomycetota bacterium]|nr:hypothetical protein [Planctomycetota bacterium]
MNPGNGAMLFDSLEDAALCESAPLWIDPTPEILDRLQAGIAQRQEFERELARLEATADRQAEWRFQQSLLALSNDRDHKLEERERTLQSEREQLDQRLAADHTAIEAESGERIAQLEEHFAAASSRIESKFQENAWLLNSLTDDTSNESPKFQLERLRQQIEQTRGSLISQDERVQTLFAQTEALIESRRGRFGDAPPPPPLAKSRDELAQRCSVATEEVELRARQIAKLILPRALAGWMPLAITVLVLAAAFAGFWFLVNPAWFSPTLTLGLEWGL